MTGLQKISLLANKILVWVGGVVLVAMIALTCGNIILRLVWVPIRGTFELMGFFGALVTAFALGYTQLKRGHIAVDVLVNTFSAGKQRFLRGVNSLICLAFAALCAWQLAVKAGVLQRSGEVTETLRIIYYPFTFLVALGCAVLALVFLVDLFKSLTTAEEGDS